MKTSFLRFPNLFPRVLAKFKIPGGKQTLFTIFEPGKSATKTKSSVPRHTIRGVYFAARAQTVFVARHFEVSEDPGDEFARFAVKISLFGLKRLFGRLSCTNAEKRVTWKGILTSRNPIVCSINPPTKSCTGISQIAPVHLICYFVVFRRNHCIIMQKSFYRIKLITIFLDPMKGLN